MDLLKEYNKCFGKFSNEDTATDTEYNIEVDDKKKEIYLRFEGSRSDEDWFQNFEFRRELNFHFLHGKLVKPFKTFFFVHGGIYSKYLAVREELHNKIDDLLKQDYTLYIHGFSQGAGLTVIAHEDFWYYSFENDLDIDKIISFAFAPPMVFSVIAAKEFKKRFAKLIVVRNINDIVPRVPGIIFLYKHYGYVITIGKWNYDLLLPWKWLKEHLGYKKLLFK